jgi:hypothetical protein
MRSVFWPSSFPMAGSLLESYATSSVSIHPRVHSPRLGIHNTPLALEFVRPSSFFSHLDYSSHGGLSHSLCFVSLPGDSSLAPILGLSTRSFSFLWAVFQIGTRLRISPLASSSSSRPPRPRPFLPSLLPTHTPVFSRSGSFFVFRPSPVSVFHTFSPLALFRPEGLGLGSVGPRFVPVRYTPHTPCTPSPVFLSFPTHSTLLPDSVSVLLFPSVSLVQDSNSVHTLFPFFLQLLGSIHSFPSDLPETSTRSLGFASSSLHTVHFFDTLVLFVPWSSLFSPLRFTSSSPSFSSVPWLACLLPSYMAFGSSLCLPISTPGISDLLPVSSHRFFRCAPCTPGFYLLLECFPLVFFCSFSSVSLVSWIPLHGKTGVHLPSSWTPGSPGWDGNRTHFLRFAIEHMTFLPPNPGVFSLARVFIRTPSRTPSKLGRLILPSSPSSFHTSIEKTGVCPPLPNPRPLGPPYTEPRVDLGLVPLESRPSSAHAIHAHLLLECRLSPSSQTPFASRSPIAGQNLASWALSDRPFYTPPVFVGRLSRRFFVFFVFFRLVCVELFVVSLSSLSF